MAFRIWKAFGVLKPAHLESATTEDGTYKYVEAQLHQEYPSVVSELNGETHALHRSGNSKETDFEYDSLHIFRISLVFISDSLKA
jgi:hypothetical protein